MIYIIRWIIIVLAISILWLPMAIILMVLALIFWDADYIGWSDTIYYKIVDSGLL